MLLKIILAILATIGGFVVLGIFVIAVLYFLLARRVTLRVRQSLQEFEAMNQSSIDAGYFREIDDTTASELEVPPMRIHLKRTSPSIWAGGTAIEEAAQWISKNGFNSLGDFSIEERPNSRLKVFISGDQMLVAAIRQDDDYSQPYVEFCFDLGANQRGGVSNPPNATVPLPAGAIGEHFRESFEDVLKILPKMLRKARDLAKNNSALKVDSGKIENFFEAAHAAEMDLRIDRGGLTAEEIRLALDGDKQSVSPSEIEGIQWDWQEAIEKFLLEQSPKGAEVYDDEGDVIVVHDGSLGSYLYQRLSSFYESESDLGHEEWQRFAGELEVLLRLFKPREAITRFRPLLPEAMRFSLLDKLRKPVEADLYLLPQLE